MSEATRPIFTRLLSPYLFVPSCALLLAFGGPACSRTSPDGTGAAGASSRTAVIAAASGIASAQAAVSGSCDDGSVFGFEDTSSWKVSSGTLSLSTVHTQGASSLAINHPVNYTTIVSPLLSSSDPALAGIAVGSKFKFDILLPTTQPNPNWFGTMQMYMNAPSRGVYSQFLGQNELTGQSLNTFITETFAIPNNVATALQGSTYSDLTITIILNVPSSGTGVYLIDNLRVNGSNGSTSNVRPALGCVNKKSSTVFEALFGYTNENTDISTFPVGPNNMFSPGASGQGQLEDYQPISSPGAFAVLFNGNPLTWTFAGGCALASSQSPACPTTACSPACKQGQQCVGGHCVTECGDGLCAGDESCNTCPVDCGCAAGQVCTQNTCATPTQCGVDWQCGSGTSFGVSVDCGACPSGQTCNRHLCQ